MKIEDIYTHVRIPIEYKDFWLVNQEFSYLEPFHSFKEEEGSAKIMMAIFMIYDPKSELVNSGETHEKIKEDVTNNFLEEGFDWSEYREYVRAYKAYTKTKLEKELDKMYNMIVERLETAENLDWEDDFEIKDKILQTHKEYIRDYQELAASVKEERIERLMHGNYTTSLLEDWVLDGR